MKIWPDNKGMEEKKCIVTFILKVLFVESRINQSREAFSMLSLSCSFLLWYSEVNSKATEEMQEMDKEIYRNWEAF